MIRIMVMDEEEQVGVRLNNILQEQGGDFCIAGIAHDHKQARRLWNEIQPDIIITETSLPGWNAQDFLSEIKEMATVTPLIVLTHANDYDSMRMMMKAGALDYLSKAALSEAELIQVLNTAKQAGEIYHQRALHSLKELLRSIQEGGVVRQTYEEVIKHIPLKPSLRSGYRIAYIQFDYRALSHEANSVIDERFLALLPTWNSNNLDYEYVKLNHHSGVFFIAESKIDAMIDTLQEIIQKAKETLELRLSITLSDVCGDLMTIPEKFQAVLQAHDRHFYMGANSIVKTWECFDFSALNPEMTDYHNRLWEALKIRDFEELLRVHRELIDDAQKHHLNPQALLDYEVFVLNNMEGNECTKGVKTLFNFCEVIASLRLCRDIKELDSVLRQAYTHMEQWFREETGNRYGKDIIDIINFVEANYTQKITLRMLADTFGMNESYLSRMFKNQTGKNLIYFINEKKMNKARELLKDPDMMVKEAAYAVGYDDQFYFNKLFKRFFGVSPTEYRRRFQPVND